MKHLLATKFVAITPPGAIVDNTSWTTASIDTQGFKQCSIFVLFGAMDIAMVALKVQESNDDGSADAYADVTGLVYGATGFTALPSATADNTCFAFHVDLRGRKRYLDVVATGGDGSAGTYMTAWAVLSRGETQPDTLAERGLAGELALPA
jgi:hypothetical protein